MCSRHSRHAPFRQGTGWEHKTLIPEGGEYPGPLQPGETVPVHSAAGGTAAHRRRGIRDRRGPRASGVSSPGGTGSRRARSFPVAIRYRENGLVGISLLAVVFFIEIGKDRCSLSPVIAGGLQFSKTAILLPPGRYSGRMRSLACSELP